MTDNIDDIEDIIEEDRIMEKKEQAIKFVADEKKEAIRLVKAYAKTHKHKISVSYNEVLDNGDVVTKWWRAADDW